MAQLMRYQMCLGVPALPNVTFGMTQGARPQGLPVPKGSPSPRAPRPQELPIPEGSRPRGCPRPCSRCTISGLLEGISAVPVRCHHHSCHCSAVGGWGQRSSGPHGAVGCAPVVGGSSAAPPYPPAAGPLGTPVPLTGFPTPRLTGGSPRFTRPELGTACAGGTVTRGGGGGGGSNAAFARGGCGLVPLWGAGEGLTHRGQRDQPGDILIPTASFSLQREGCCN